MSKPGSKLTIRSIVLAGVAIFLSSGAYLGLHEFEPAKAQTPISVEQQIIPVSVHTVVPRKVRVWSEFSGRLSAVDYAEIRPEVSGRITEVRFRDGETVKAGEILYVIDPRPFEAAVAKAEANLASARTNADYAQVELDRATTLIRSQAIAQRIYDQTANAKRVADAAVLAADAELKQARIDIDHAYVKAPITGRMSRPEITVGNLVQAGPNAPLLTSIVSNDGIYADFDVDEQTYLESVRSGADTDAKEKKIPVELTVSGQKDHRYRGTIYSFDNRISTSSGTIRARAKFDNRDGKLVPGMFIAVKIGGGGEDEVVTVPVGAIGTDQTKKFVLLANAENSVVYREVTLGPEVTGERVVLTGLRSGERVIVNGMQRVQPGARVAPTEAVSNP